jgi:GTP cyclohydrolase II
VPLATVHGGFIAHRFRHAASGADVVAVTCGDVRGPAPLLTRVHSSCVTSEAIGASDCDCAEQLDWAFARLAAAGRGLVIYLMQEGRGAGLVAKARDRMLVQASGHRLTTFDAYARLGLPADQRRYDDVRAALSALDVTAALLLLSNNAEKVAAVARAGVPLAGVRPLACPASPFNRHYLDSKAAAGHRLATSAGGAAPLPAAVRWFAPHPVAGVPRFLAQAAYLVPLRAAGAWARLRLYVDRESRAERIVLELGDVAAAANAPDVPLVRIQHETFLERLPLADPPARRRWHAALARLAADAGVALFAPADGPPVDDAALALLARHLPGRARPLVGDGDETALHGRLAAHGVALGPPVPVGAAA